MSYVVLARKYRPMRFADMVGQEHIARTLGNAITQQRVHHAYLFAGARGLGKTTTARIFAKGLVCEQGPTPEPCNVCSECMAVSESRSVDVMEIDGASNNSVDNIRNLREQVHYLPQTARRKVYIIDEVHMLTTSAFNALLKTLEEPPPHVNFVFATTEPHKVLPTILSRVNRLDFKRVSPTQLVEFLGTILEREGLAVEEGGLRIVARAGGGSVRDALTLLDQVIAFAEDATKVGESEVRRLLGQADATAVYELVDAILNRDPTATMQRFDALVTAGNDLVVMSLQVLEHLRDLTVMRVCGTPQVLPDATEAELALLRSRGAKVDAAHLGQLFDRFSRVIDRLPQTRTPRLLVEMGLLDLACAEPVMPLGDLVDRLHALGSGAPPPPQGRGGGGRGGPSRGPARGSGGSAGRARGGDSRRFSPEQALSEFVRATEPAPNGASPSPPTREGGASRGGSADSQPSAAPARPVQSRNEATTRVSGPDGPAVAAERESDANSASPSPAVPSSGAGLVGDSGSVPSQTRPGPQSIEAASTGRPNEHAQPPRSAEAGADARPVDGGGQPSRPRADTRPVDDDRGGPPDDFEPPPWDELPADLVDLASGPTPPMAAAAEHNGTLHDRPSPPPTSLHDAAPPQVRPSPTAPASEHNGAALHDRPSPSSPAAVPTQASPVAAPATASPSPSPAKPASSVSGLAGNSFAAKLFDMVRDAGAISDGPPPQRETDAPAPGHPPSPAVARPNLGHHPNGARANGAASNGAASNGAPANGVANIRMGAGLCLPSEPADGVIEWEELTPIEAWEKLVARVRNEDEFVAAVLGELGLVDLAGGVLKVAAPRGSFAHTELNRHPQLRAQLEQACRDHLGAPFAIELVEGEPVLPDLPSLVLLAQQRRAEHRAAVEAEAQSHPGINAVLRAFSGELVGTKPLREPS